MLYIFSILLLTNILYGKDFLIKTKNKKYLMRGLKNRKNTDNLAMTGVDYEEPAWLNKCSLKKEGPMKDWPAPPAERSLRRTDLM